MPKHNQTQLGEWMDKLKTFQKETSNKQRKLNWWLSNKK
jgi:hypothetical protein